MVDKYTLASLGWFWAEGLIKATKKKQSHNWLKCREQPTVACPVLTRVSAPHPLNLRLREHLRTGHIKTERVTGPEYLLRDVFYRTGKVYL